MQNRMYKIKSVIENVISENIPVIEENISSELKKRQAEDNARVAANKERFQNDIPTLKASLKSTMKAYTDQRQQYISQKILQSAPFKFFLGETKKNENNEGYISVFSNTDSDQYSLALYEKLINEINSITNLNSGNIALQNIGKLLTDDAQKQSPTLCGYAGYVIAHLRQKLNPSDYHASKIQTLHEILPNQIKSLSLEIKKYADSLLEKKLSEILSNDSILKNYNQYLEEVAKYKSIWMQTTEELNSYKNEAIDYRAEARDDYAMNANPWNYTPPTEIEIQILTSRFMTHGVPSRQYRLEDLESADTDAYIQWENHAKFAAQYARSHHLSEELIALANNNYGMETKLQAFIPEKDIQSICSEIKEYSQSKIQAENTAASESDQLETSGVSSMRLKR